MGLSLKGILGGIKSAASAVVSGAKKLAVPAMAVGALATGGVLPAIPALGGLAGKLAGLGGIANKIGSFFGKASSATNNVAAGAVEVTPVPIASAPVGDSSSAPGGAGIPNGLKAAAILGGVFLLLRPGNSRRW